MDHWHNESGSPLSSTAWLQAHHRAKLTERRLFAQSILDCQPKRIVDLGCGPGLWLELLNELAPADCEFFGIDNNLAAIEEARRRAENWSRPTRFLNLDLDENIGGLPNADTFLAFNLFPYLREPAKVINAIKAKTLASGRLIVRQYDGALLRFGPEDQRRRGRMETSLQTSVLGSEEFRHYDLDSIFEILEASQFAKKELAFELFQRISPYPPEFNQYLTNMLAWIAAHTAPDVSSELTKWLAETSSANRIAPSYFLEVDLVGWLS